MKKLMIAAVILLILIGCNGKETTEALKSKDNSEMNKATATPSSKPVKQMTEQEIALIQDEVKSKFVVQFGLDAATVSKSLLYDITNDGSDEIVLYTEKEMTVG